MPCPLRGIQNRTIYRAAAGAVSPTKNSPLLFGALTPVCFALIALLLLPFSAKLFWTGMVGMLIHWMVGVPSIVFKSNFCFDITGEISVFFVVLTSVLVNGAYSPRQLISTFLVLVWDIRLGYFLFKRILVRGGDWRFDEMNDFKVYTLFCWSSQPVWLVYTVIPLMLLHASPTEANGPLPLGMADFLGWLIFAVGLGLEIKADNEKSAYTKNIRHGEHKGKWLQTGLWNYSRHPNFFGECVVWLGVALFCARGLRHNLRWLAVSFISPPFVMFFFFYTSLFLLELYVDTKCAKSPGYQEYKEDVSALVLMPRFDKGRSAFLSHGVAGICVMAYVAAIFI